MEFTKQIVIEQTNEHKNDVSFAMDKIISQLIERANKHDYTKYEKPELLALALNERQNGNREPMKEWTKFHSQEDHHIEHYTDPSEMNLLQMLEMCVDGACASYRRTKDLVINKEDQINHFMKDGFSLETATMLANTFLLVREILDKRELELSKKVKDEENSK